MKQKILKTVLITFISLLSFLSYTYLNCCTSVQNGLLPTFEEANIESLEQEEQLALPDLTIIQKTLEVVRNFLPAS